MALPPDIEAQLQECETRTSAANIQLRKLSQSVEELVDTLDSGDGDGDAVPSETFDDPSVVRHVDAVRSTAARVKRSSTPQPAVVHAAKLRGSQR